MGGQSGLSKREMLGLAPAFALAAAIPAQGKVIELTPETRVWAMHYLSTMVIDWHSLMAALNEGSNRQPYYWKPKSNRPDLDRSFQGTMQRAQLVYLQG